MEEIGRLRRAEFSYLLKKKKRKRDGQHRNGVGSVSHFDVAAVEMEERLLHLLFFRCRRRRRRRRRRPSPPRETGK